MLRRYAATFHEFTVPSEFPAPHFFLPAVQ